MPVDLCSVLLKPNPVSQKSLSCDSHRRRIAMFFYVDIPPPASTMHSITEHLIPVYYSCRCGACVWLLPVGILTLLFKRTELNLLLRLSFPKTCFGNSRLFHQVLPCSQFECTCSLSDRGYSIFHCPSLVQLAMSRNVNHTQLIGAQSAKIDDHMDIHK